MTANGRGALGGWFQSAALSECGRYRSRRAVGCWSRSGDLFGEECVNNQTEYLGECPFGQGAGTPQAMVYEVRDILSCGPVGAPGQTT